MRATMGPEMTDQLLTTTVLERGRKKTLNEVTNSLHKPFSHFFFLALLIIANNYCYFSKYC